MVKRKMVNNYPLTKYNCGLNAGDLVELVRSIVIKDTNSKPTGVRHLKGEIWNVLPGSKQDPGIVWLRQADGDTHTWDDDETIFHTFKKIKRGPKNSGRYQRLIEGLFKHGLCVQKNHDALIKADHRAFKPLVTALLDSYDPLVREACAEILGDRKSAKAIPSLIEALLDKSLYVRQDALWSIERLSGYQTGALQDWLNITNMDKPKKLHSSVSKWYKTNKLYIQRI